ncbi:hypothetical protein KI387_023872, partial [Taxus chinensis]
PFKPPFLAPVNTQPDPEENVSFVEQLRLGRAEYDSLPDDIKMDMSYNDFMDHKRKNKGHGRHYDQRRPSNQGDLYQAVNKQSDVEESEVDRAPEESEDEKESVGVLAQLYSFQRNESFKFPVGFNLVDFLLQFGLLT